MPGISCGFWRGKEREKLENERACVYAQEKAAYAIKSQQLSCCFFGGKTTFTLYRHFVIFQRCFFFFFALPLRRSIFSSFSFIVFYYASKREKENSNLFLWTVTKTRRKNHLGTPEHSAKWRLNLEDLLSYVTASFQGDSFNVPKISAPKKCKKINLKIKLCNFHLNVVRNTQKSFESADLWQCWCDVCVCVTQMIFLNFLCFRRIFHRHHTSNFAFVDLLFPFPCSQRQPPARVINGRKKLRRKILPMPVWAVVCVIVLPACMYECFTTSNIFLSTLFYFSLHSKLSLRSLNSWKFHSEGVTHIFLPRWGIKGKENKKAQEKLNRRKKKLKPKREKLESPGKIEWKENSKFFGFLLIFS